MIPCIHSIFPIIHLVSIKLDFLQLDVFIFERKFKCLSYIAKMFYSQNRPTLLSFITAVNLFNWIRGLNFWPLGGLKALIYFFSWVQLACSLKTAHRLPLFYPGFQTPTPRVLWALLFRGVCMFCKQVSKMNAWIDVESSWLAHFVG